MSGKKASVDTGPNMRELADYAKKVGCSFRSVCLLAGIGVTHEFVPNENERPGMYGASQNWTRRRSDEYERLRTNRRSTNERVYSLV